MSDAHHPIRELEVRAWGASPMLDELRRRQLERDADGQPAHDLVWLPDDDWLVLVYRPLDPTDPRPAVRLRHWPACHLERLEADWRARLTEVDA